MDNFTEEELARIYWLVLLRLTEHEKTCFNCQHEGVKSCKICRLKEIRYRLETIMNKISIMLWED